MDLEAEVHSIKEKLTEIVTAIAVIKERRTNDKESAEALAGEVDKLAIAVNQLNLILANTDGFSAGVSTTVKTFRAVFGVLLLTAVISFVTIILSNASDITTIKEHLKIEQ